MKIKFLKWTKDKFLSKNGNIIVYDKIEHFVRDAVISGILLFFGVALWLSIVLAGIFNVAWEIKDGIKPYIKDSIEGFSWKDLISGFAGILFTVIIYLILT